MSQRTTAEEIRKQLIDQTAHSLWGIATGSAFMAGGIVLPWAGVAGVVLACGSCWFWTHRERLQFRDGAHLAFDPLLDNAIFWASVGIGAILAQVLLGIGKGVTG